MVIAVDQIDAQILELLKKNGRITHSDIGKIIHLSLPAVSERVRKLETGGFIDRFTVKLNREMMGTELLSFIFVALERPEHIGPFRAAMEKEEAVLECHHLAGEFDYILKAATRNTKELEELLSNRIKQIPGIVKTNTMIVLSTVKEE
ncbi:MAG: transcriptional regulator [Paenibacillaceae bacterium]|nr:transcriptional regulator [Paenibacillaceae bacterium]